MTTTYAEVDDVIVTRRQDSADPRYLATVQRYLEDATADLTEAIGYSFLRQPDASTTSWITTGSGCAVLHVHEGLADLTGVEIRFSAADSWTALDDTDWVLEGEVGEPLILAGEPAFHVVLLPTAAYSEFPRGRQLVRLTGARGWPSMPTRARSATVALVRQRLGLDQTGQGGAFGPEELGARVGPDLWPRAAYDLLRLEQGRHRGCSM